VEFLGSFRYKIMSSANRDNLTSSFPIQIPFIFFSCLIAQARNSTIILNKNEENKHPCFVPDFRGNVSVFPHLGCVSYMFLVFHLNFVEVCSFSF
jgi:hypothetical protein